MLHQSSANHTRVALRNVKVASLACRAGFRRSGNHWHDSRPATYRATSRADVAASIAISAGHVRIRYAHNSRPMTEIAGWFPRRDFIRICRCPLAQRAHDVLRLNHVGSFIIAILVAIAVPKTRCGRNRQPRAKATTENGFEWLQTGEPASLCPMKTGIPGEIPPRSEIRMQRIWIFIKAFAVRVRAGKIQFGCFGGHQRQGESALSMASAPDRRYAFNRSEPAPLREKDARAGGLE